MCEKKDAAFSKYVMETTENWKQRIKVCNDWCNKQIQTSYYTFEKKEKLRAKENRGNRFFLYEQINLPLSSSFE